MAHPTEFKLFLWRLFVSNEDTKASDDVIAAVIRKAYPKSDIDKPVGRSRTRVTIWRSEYNRGLFPKKPPVYSFRYNEAGEACNQYGYKLFSWQIAEKLKEFNRKFRDGRNPQNVGNKPKA